MFTLHFSHVNVWRLWGMNWHMQFRMSWWHFLCFDVPQLLMDCKNMERVGRTAARLHWHCRDLVPSACYLPPPLSGHVLQQEALTVTGTVPYLYIYYIRMYLYYACISIRLTSCTIDEWPRGMLNQLMHCLMNLDMLWCVWNDGVYLMCCLIVHPYSKYMFSNDGASLFPLSLAYMSNALCYTLQHPEEVWPSVLISKPLHNWAHFPTAGNLCAYLCTLSNYLRNQQLSRLHLMYIRHWSRASCVIHILHADVWLHENCHCYTYVLLFIASPHHCGVCVCVRDIWVILLILHFYICAHTCT